MIDHIGLDVSDIKKSKEFGEKTMPHLHIAFRAENRTLVDEFYQAALAAGAKDNGAPGIREIYHSNYYGAFVLGPDGHNIEVVRHNAK